MQHRIRASGLVVRDGCILLVKHRRPGQTDVWWSPPGGGVEGVESVLRCAEREVYEETALYVVAERVVYIREYIDAMQRYHNIEIYVLATAPAGEPDTSGVAGLSDEEIVRDARFVSREEIADIDVFPRELRESFWDDHARGFPCVQYLGIHQA